MNKYIINKSNGTTFDLYFGEQNGLNATPTTKQVVGVGLGGAAVNFFQLFEDMTYRFGTGFQFDIVNSAGGFNDGTYTVTSSSFDGTHTTVIVNEILASVTPPYGFVSYLIPSAEIASSLLFSGRGVLNFGESLVENSLHLLEHFSNTTAPANAIAGQLWYKSDTDEMLRYTTGNQWTTNLNVGSGIVTFVDPQHPTSNITPIIHLTGNDSDVGASLKMIVNPISGNSLFRVLSDDDNERLRVEHDGYVSTTNSLNITGTTLLNHFDNTLEFANDKGISSVGNATLTTQSNGFTWEILGGQSLFDSLRVLHADTTLMFAARGNKSMESLVDFKVATDVMFVQVSTGRVGIGTATPAQELDVIGDVQVSGQMLLSNGTLALPSLSFTSNNSVGIRLNGTNNIGFVSGGAEKMVISNTGLVSVVQAAYETLVLNDNDVPNKKYVDDGIVGGQLSQAKLYFFGFGS